MKIHLLVISAVCLATQASAVNGYNMPPPGIESTKKSSEKSQGNAERANKLIGMDVSDQQNQKVGTIKDMAVDLQNGRVAAVILSTGGLTDRRLVAVPPQSFQMDPRNKSLQLSLTQEQLKTAPKFDMAQWKGSMNREQLAQTYQHYGAKPYFSTTDQGAGASLTSADKASELIGKTAKNTQNENVGKVENLIVDLPNGRVVHVIVASGGFLGMQDEMSVVPPSLLSHTAQRDDLVINTTKEAMSKAPHFKSSQWPDFNEPSYTEQAYQAYGVAPYAAADADNTKRNVREASGSELTPFDQGKTESERQTTAQIRKAIVDNENLSVNAHNVKIMTTGNKVTLRGPVNSEEEKRLVGDTAAKAFPSGSVDNQLEVKHAPGAKTGSD